jgi:hypothetical protein
VGAAATNTRIRGNVVVGNPPIQVSTAVPGSVGVDIWNLSASGATTFDKNLCTTSINAPCPGQPVGIVPRKPAGQ